MDEQHESDGEAPHDPGAMDLRSLREAIDDGFSVGHADAMSAEDKLRGLIEGDAAGQDHAERERAALARFDQLAAVAAAVAAASRGVPRQYRRDWCGAYVRGSAVAHGEIALNRKAAT